MKKQAANSAWITIPWQLLKVELVWSSIAYSEYLRTAGP